MPARAKLPPIGRVEQRRSAQASRALHDGRSMLSVAQAADYLGVSRFTLYRVLRSGKLRAAQIEGVVRVRPSDLDDYVERCFVS